jgi:hypothetical protein
MYQEVGKTTRKQQIIRGTHFVAHHNLGITKKRKRHVNIINNFLSTWAMSMMGFNGKVAQVWCKVCT